MTLENQISKAEEAQDSWPSLGGADVELANFTVGREPSMRNGVESALAILSQIDGVSEPETPRWNSQGEYGNQDRPIDPQDWHRKYLKSCGGCVYIDLGHVEIALPCVRSAEDFVTYWNVMLREVSGARRAANLRMPAGQQIEVLATNSDGRANGSSWGSHLNFCLPRRAFDRILFEKLHHTLLLASYHASAILFSGQGKVGAENARPAADYQISARADWMERMTGIQTTFSRPLCNLRDEALCGTPRCAADTSASRRPAQRWARLHVICHDSTMSPVGNFLKFGVTQLVLAMIGHGQINPRLILEDPVEAIVGWSHDPTLQRRMTLLTGGSMTILDHQLALHEEVQQFTATGRCTIPQTERILALWGDTLGKLKSRDFDSLAPRLDWVRKLSILRQAMAKHPQLSWDSPGLKHLDRSWASLDDQSGLYWAMRRAGAVEQIVDEEQIARAMSNPPEDSRAWARAMLLRAARPGQVRRLDWDRIEFAVAGRWGYVDSISVELNDPFMTRGDFERLTRGCDTLEEMLDALGATTVSFGQGWSSGAVNESQIVRRD